MKTLLLNLPYRSKIMRRYPCSYNVRNFLFPPLELMYLGSIIKHWKKEEVILIDAIAEGLNLENVLKRIDSFKPDSLVFMPGFEIFSEDMKSIEEIKREFSNLKIICFGYLPSIFPQETLKNNQIDFVIMDEPEISFSELYDALKYRMPISNLKGIAYRENGNIILNERRERIEDLDQLPYPDYSLIRVKSYSEFLLDKPFAMVQAARGCPFECNYCTKTFGNKFSIRSIKNITDELKKLKSEFNIKSVRFIDDTFTLNKERVKRICEQIIKDKTGIKWSCLSRADTFDRETIKLMKKSGCIRVYIGIESGSQKILDFYRKGYRIESIKMQIKALKDSGIEIVGFFMVGSPYETEEDFLKSRNLAKDLDFDYLMVSMCTPYPGTELFEDLKDKIDFNLFPYINKFKDPDLKKRTIIWEKELYRKFYFRPGYIIKKIKFFVLKPKDLLKGALALMQYLLFLGSSKERDDFI